ncbi:MAG: hypothetical protein MUE49_13740, partial [Rhodospirillales bacterium]|nr:hypothetical protein [Rhodospirillales bacterium]
DRLAAALRSGVLPLVGRIADDRLLLDPRTVAPELDDAVLRAVREAWERTTKDEGRKTTVPTGE